jgi:hypothetical protein
MPAANARSARRSGLVAVAALPVPLSNWLSGLILLCSPSSFAADSGGNRARALPEERSIVMTAALSAVLTGLPHARHCLR